MTSKLTTAMAAAIVADTIAMKSQVLDSAAATT
jgi:hypothetical protein